MPASPPAAALFSPRPGNGALARDADPNTVIKSVHGMERDRMGVEKALAMITPGSITPGVTRQSSSSSSATAREPPCRHRRCVRELRGVGWLVRGEWRKSGKIDGAIFPSPDCLWIIKDTLDDFSGIPAGISSLRPKGMSSAET